MKGRGSAPRSTARINHAKQKAAKYIKRREREHSTAECETVRTVGDRAHNDERAQTSYSEIL